MDATFRLEEGLQEDGEARDIDSTTCRIRGRGNSTWGLKKNPYKLKFDEKISILGEDDNKEWVLLANHLDKTMLRNHTAFYMSRQSSLGYTPSSHFVELVLNDEYVGTYELTDQVKIGHHRVDATEGGFLMEIDSKPDDDDVLISVPHIEAPINIKDTAEPLDSVSLLQVQTFMNTVDSVLFSDDFDDPDKGWRQLMDEDSFVEWYMINEICKNNDAYFYTSCYMWWQPGDKLHMGPVWDFDISLGNTTHNGNYYYDGFWVRYVTWYKRLFQDELFCQKIMESFRHFYALQDDIMQEINKQANYLRYSVEENDNKWGTLYSESPSYAIWGNYTNEVVAMKTWLSNRLEWLKENW